VTGFGVMGQYRSEDSTQDMGASLSNAKNAKVLISPSIIGHETIFSWNPFLCQLIKMLLLFLYAAISPYDTPFNRKVSPTVFNLLKQGVSIIFLILQNNSWRQFGVKLFEWRWPNEIFIPQILILRSQNDEIYTLTFHLWNQSYVDSSTRWLICNRIQHMGTIGKKAGPKWPCLLKN